VLGRIGTGKPNPDGAVARDYECGRSGKINHGQVLFVVGDFARIVLDGIFGFIGNGLGGALAAEFGMGGFLGTVAVIETVAHTVVVNPVRVAPTAPHLIENIAPVFLAFLFAVLIAGQGFLLLDRISG
jgi:hypothetical protein